MKILSIIRISVDKQFGYGYLKAIVVRRGFIRFSTFSVSAGAPISAGDPNPAVTSVSAGLSVSAASSIPAATPIDAGIPTPAWDFVPAGHISFLLVVSHSCWPSMGQYRQAGFFISFYVNISRGGLLEPVSYVPADNNSFVSADGFIRFLTFSVSTGAPIFAGDPNPAVTSVSAGFSVSAASSIPVATPIAAGIPIPVGDFVPAGIIPTGELPLTLMVLASLWFLLACSILFLLLSPDLGSNINEADFAKLHLNDIEDMYLLYAQNKLHHLKGDKQVDLVTALCLFIQRIVLKKRVEEVQLWVESYQIKLNITMPQVGCPGIEVKEPYTILCKPKGLVYLNKRNCKFLTRDDELYKFSDGTLKPIRDTLNLMSHNYELGYNNASILNRAWSEKDQKRQHPC
nr:hypothetical protein [Tanacetum cinerariifolium]